LSWKNIVVGIDGSEQSENALRAAIDLAKGINAHIQITAVYTNPTMLGFLPRMLRRCQKRSQQPSSRW